jgi:hypothetical protein
MEFGRFPRNPDDTAGMLADLNDVDLNSSLMIMISHCWLRGHPLAPGYSGQPHPDNEDNEKYALCVEAIQKAHRSMAPG